MAISKNVLPLQADVETDEVYAQMTLQPLTPEEQKDTFLPMKLGIPSKQHTWRVLCSSSCS